MAVAREDVEEVLQHGVEIVVLSRGMHLVLQTQRRTEEFLRSRNTHFLIAEPRNAVSLFNKLTSSGYAVGALLHSTC